MKDELARVHEAKIKEAASLKKKAKDIVALYRHCLNGIRCDTQLPADYSAAPFLDWLSGEVSALEGHMTLGRDFTTVTAIKAVRTGLSEASCDHLEHLDLSDVDRYFQVSPEANSIAGSFSIRFGPWAVMTWPS